MEAVYGAVLFLSILINSLSANVSINGENPETYVLTSIIVNLAVLGFLIRNYFTKRIPINILLSTFSFSFISLVLNVISYYRLTYEPNNRRLYSSLSGLLIGSAIVSSIAYIPYIVMLLQSRTKKSTQTLDFPPAPTRQAPKSKYREALNRPLPPTPSTSRPLRKHHFPLPPPPPEQRPLPPTPIKEPSTYMRKYY